MVLLAVTKSRALMSWAGVTLFGVLTIAWGFLTPVQWRHVTTLGRRLPKPLRSLYPAETDPRYERTTHRAKSQIFWVGAAFVIIGTVGFFVRLALR